jgi:hypothetical protein
MMIEHCNDLSGNAPGRVSVVMAVDTRTSMLATWVCTSFDNQRRLKAKLEASDRWKDVRSMFVPVYDGGAI